MSQEDFVQKSDVFYFNGTMSSGVLIPQMQRGRGSIERVSPGVLHYTLPDGQGISPALIIYMFMDNDTGDAETLSCQYDKAQSNPQFHVFHIVDDESALYDAGDFSLFISTIQ